MQRGPFSYLPEVMRIYFAIGFLAEVKKSFSERWVPLPYAVFEFFNNFLLGHFLSGGSQLLLGKQPCGEARERELGPSVCQQLPG